MTTNIGRIDRSLRIAGGTLLIGLALAGVISPLGYIGVLPLVTGLWGYCPVYGLIKRR